MSLYEQLTAAGVQLNSHYSDLYCPATPEALAIIRASGKSHSFFTSNIDGKVWVDVPFAFDPYWEAKMKEREATNRA